MAGLAEPDAAGAETPRYMYRFEPHAGTPRRPRGIDDFVGGRSDGQRPTGQYYWSADVYGADSAALTTVRQPKLRRRGPRRGHVGGPAARPAVRRSSRVTRAGPDDGSGSSEGGGDQPPPPGLHLDHEDPDVWLADRRRVLGALIAG